jgi:hypothetical protein
MRTVAYVFRRVSGMSIEESRRYYRDVPGPLMVDILKDRGPIAACFPGKERAQP